MMSSAVHVQPQQAGAEPGPGIAVMTSRFGRIEVDRDKVITMTSPFLGFPESRRFILRPHGQDSPFFWLQSLDNPDLAFVVIQPGLINPEYRPEVGHGVRKELALGRDEAAEVLVILTIPRDRPQQMTANLLGPVVINSTKRLARQVVLDPAKYESGWLVLGKRR